MALGMFSCAKQSGLEPRARRTHVICDLCGKRENTKHHLVEHLKTCVSSRTCNWCNAVFKNRGNLFSHRKHMHRKETSKTAEIKKITTSNFKCSVCPKSYTQVTNLRYHIRREHFNLMERIMETEKRKLNEVWFERVFNSDALVEIRKVKGNMYLMRKAAASDALQISEPVDSVDLSPFYPTHVRKKRVWCHLCNKSFCQKDFQKHLNERHEKMSHHERNKTFKRPYRFLEETTRGK